MNARDPRVGVLVRKKCDGEFGMLIEVQRSYEVDPHVCRFKILWCRLGFNWDRLADIEVYIHD